jgi:hypothetical protein
MGTYGWGVLEGGEQGWSWVVGAVDVDIEVFGIALTTVMGASS